MPLENLDMDQQKVLFVYSLYSDEKELKFFQYTAALAACYYLMKKGVFPNYKDQLLVYDYKNSRRYLWEDKKFMNDINILRQNDTLIRARARNRQYRDINSHQCSNIGHEFLTKSNFKKTEEGKQILKFLQCKDRALREIYLEDEYPVLKCPRCKKTEVIEGFLYNLHEPIGIIYQPFILGGD